MYELGIVVGIIAGIVILALGFKLFCRLTHRDGIAARYDERQQAARGRGYRYAFFTMLILNALAMFWYSTSDGAAQKIPVPQIFWGIILAGLMVYVSYAIWTDAYIGTNETFRSSLVMIALIGAINLGIGIMNLRERGFSEAYLNLGIGAMMAIVCVEMFARNQYNCPGEDEDAE